MKHAKGDALEIIGNKSGHMFKMGVMVFVVETCYDDDLSFQVSDGRFNGWIGHESDIKLVATLKENKNHGIRMPFSFTDFLIGFIAGIFATIFFISYLLT